MPKWKHDMNGKKYVNPKTQLRQTMYARGYDNNSCSLSSKMDKCPLINLVS